MQPLPVLAIAAMAVFISAILATVFGAVGGFIVGLVFPDTMSLLSDTIGIEAAPWQLGAMFGFVGSFFRSSVSSSQ